MMVLDHLLIPLDMHGIGPCAEEDAVDHICWCGDVDCTLWVLDRGEDEA